ncbi:NAD-dependent epimerase/dehydratase family protein [bacterium]|jgi:UDP-glucose 4-epimerase|nr:NAD-dependent epimerase/dehydratase family protein [bacterium]MBT4291259.1 NAD-dependent epimerase/dehydratase family protein [bacterium]MBT7311234.1 NAD-dependent epimerase/dehydratase family protein [bacterium]
MLFENKDNLLKALPGGEIPSALRDGAKVVVTGCAGFIGSHLTEALLLLGCKVTGVDCITDYYDTNMKRENLSGFITHPSFTFIEEDLCEIDCVGLLAGSSACFHLAAQAGVRASWGSFFDEYLQRNILATQRLLEASTSDKVAPEFKRFVYSSSSSIYGDRDDLPVSEAALPGPHSPYGVTKLAAEHLCCLYSDNYDVPTSSLRYFTVYGPRQRPDMAFRKFIEAALDGKPWTIFGDGSQTRDFTFVADVVIANILATSLAQPKAVMNVGGGSRVVLSEVLLILQKLIAEAAPGVEPVIEYLPVEKGDVRDTWSDPTKIDELLGFKPAIQLPDGLAQQVQWVVNRRKNLE